MKPIEIYNRTPESINHDFSYLFGTYYDFLPEIGDDWGWKVDWKKVNGLENPRITIKTIRYFNFDGRRFWQLATVWFDDKPIMITRNAGREGDDHATRFVTNEDGYRQMIKYVQSLIGIEVDLVEDLVDPNEDINELETFYGNTLDGLFEKYRY